jgi:maleylpyruvate isomerase
VKLYGYWRSSATYRVRIALGLKGLEYEVVPVHLLEGGGQQHADEFKARNPMAQVPVLEVQEGAKTVELAQSIAIFEYLEEAYPRPALLPADPVLRARARQLTEVVNSGIQPLQNLFVLQRLKEHGVDGTEWMQLFVRRGLAAYQTIAETTAGKFSVGDQPTFADCALIPQLYGARRNGIDVEAELPLLARIEAACSELPAFQAAHPDRQPDAPSPAA